MIPTYRASVLFNAIVPMISLPIPTTRLIPLITIVGAGVAPAVAGPGALTVLESSEIVDASELPVTLRNAAFSCSLLRMMTSAALLWLMLYMKLPTGPP